MNSDTKDSFRTQAMDSIVKRRIDVTRQQEEELNANSSPVFLKVTKKCIDAEKKLIAFITKSLSLNLVLDLAASL